jgi:hypothetical protein
VEDIMTKLSDLDPLEAQGPDAGDLALPQQSCHRTREHVPHVQYVNLMPQFRCPGVGAFQTVVAAPADPFAGIE